MPTSDRSEIKKLVQDLRAEAVGYSKQWMVWLGVASGGGAVALLSFAANLPDPDFALRALLPALAAFAGGVCFAGLAVLTAGLRTEASEHHYGAAFNRNELGDAIHQMPEMISNPRRLADEHNTSRNALSRQRDEFHADAEKAWRRHVWWRRINQACLIASAALFLMGISAPLIHVAMGKPYTQRPADSQCGPLGIKSPL